MYNEPCFNNRFLTSDCIMTRFVTPVNKPVHYLGNTAVPKQLQLREIKNDQNDRGCGVYCTFFCSFLRNTGSGAGFCFNLRKQFSRTVPQKAQKLAPNPVSNFIITKNTEERIWCVNSYILESA